MHEFKEPNEPTPTELSENEELNSERLNALKNALDDLKIVGVKQKPAETNQVKLQEYGFYPFPTTDENNEKGQPADAASTLVTLPLTAPVFPNLELHANHGRPPGLVVAHICSSDA